MSNHADIIAENAPVGCRAFGSFQVLGSRQDRALSDLCPAGAGTGLAPGDVSGRCLHPVVRNPGCLPCDTCRDYLAAHRDCLHGADHAKGNPHSAAVLSLSAGFQKPAWTSVSNTIRFYSEQSLDVRFSDQFLGTEYPHPVSAGERRHLVAFNPDIIAGQPFRLESVPVCSLEVSEVIRIADGDRPVPLGLHTGDTF